MTNAPNLVLLNGWAGHQPMWLPLLSQIESAGLVADVTYLEPDYCELSRQWREQPADFCRQLADSLPANTLLLGWSLGGMLATRIAALAGDNVRALVCLSTNLCFVANQSWPKAMTAETFEGFADLFAGKPRQALKRFALLEVHGDQQAKVQLQHMQHRPEDRELQQLTAGLELLAKLDNSDCLQSIGCPVLHCFGEADALVPASAAGAITRLAPQHQVEVLSDCGHVLHYPAARLQPLLVDFIKGLGASDDG